MTTYVVTGASTGIGRAERGAIGRARRGGVRRRATRGRCRSAARRPRREPATAAPRRHRPGPDPRGARHRCDEARRAAARRAGEQRGHRRRWSDRVPVDRRLASAVRGERVRRGRDHEGVPRSAASGSRPQRHRGIDRRSCGEPDARSLRRVQARHRGACRSAPARAARLGDPHLGGRAGRGGHADLGQGSVADRLARARSPTRGARALCPIHLGRATRDRSTGKDGRSSRTRPRRSSSERSSHLGQRARYVVGNDARLQAVFARVAPDTWRDAAQRAFLERL